MTNTGSSFWNNLKEYEKQALGFVDGLELKGFTPEEIKDLFTQMERLLTISKDKGALMRAVTREGKLLDYQRLRKRISWSRRKYHKSSRATIEILQAQSEPKFDDSGESKSVLHAYTFDAWTKEFSKSTKWRMKKELQDQGVEIEK